MAYDPIKYSCRHVFHTPTYCFLSYRDADGNLPQYKRHILQRFSKSNQVQSKNSINRLRNAINWMLLFAEKKTVFSKKENKKFTFRLAFVTLTLPSTQKHPDKFIKEHMLQPFLYWLSRYFKASYVWKAETQLNGNIHFHLTIDTFVPWRSVRSKWNQICAHHGYCKVFQDGSNDLGDACTQIKAIKNENDLNKTVAGYLTKGSIEEKNHYDLKRKKLSIAEIKEKYPHITFDASTGLHYSRFVEGRVWGCSNSLSKIKCFTSEMDIGFTDTEHQFFHDNKVTRLSELLIKEELKKVAKMSFEERNVLGKDDLSIKNKYNPYANVFIHRHLKFCKLPDALKHLLAEAKQGRKFTTQKHFTVDSLL